MTIRKSLVGTVAVCIALGGFGVSTAGCDKKEEETETEEETEEETEPETKAEEETKAADDTGDVETYPEMTKAGGTFRLLRSFSVHQAADANSKKLTGLAKGTLVDFKNFHRDWIMIDWPSGPGELSPGWIQISSKQRSTLTKREVRKKEPEVEVKDAGKPEVEVKDAGKPEEEVKDAGKPAPKPPKGKRTFKFRRRKK
jgi:hypothetical protein